MGVSSYLISARFLTTIGHLTNVFLLFSTIQNNIEISLGDGVSSSEYLKAYQSSNAALIFSLFCFVIDFSGIFLGTSLFNQTVSPCAYKSRWYDRINDRNDCQGYFLLSIHLSKNLILFCTNFPEFSAGKCDPNIVSFCGWSIPISPDNWKLRLQSSLADHCCHEHSTCSCRTLYGD
jgi:Transmembrane protein